MKSPQQVLEARLAAASLQLFASAEVQVKPCADARHGDFQTNAAMIRAKELGKNPREVAAELAALLPEDDAFTAPVIAGPGFLNFTLKAGWLNRALAVARAEGRLGIETEAQSGTVVLDFSGPNVAKEMHVGHIRSTILGDALARCHRFLGRTVVTDNHLGDWGTQFGKILLGYKRHGNEADLAARPVEHLEALYQQIHEASKTDEAIQEEARKELLALQQGNPESLALWKRFVAATLAELDKIYSRLGVRFDETLGESAYNDRLDGVVKELKAKGIARESEGAVVVFFDQPGDDAQLADKPFLIQKSDEAFLYATTDLATVAYRVERWKPIRIIYVTDGRQQLHFQQLFATVRKWGIDRVVPTALEHVWFGAILGNDKKPLKTREGKPIKLRELLDEAESRALEIITEKRPELSEERRQEIARVVGLGALKFADLGQNRNLDYVFDWKKLLAFEGNTAPYLQNGYVRIKSIFRKAAEQGVALPAADAGAPLDLREEAEIALGKKLLAFGETLRIVAAESRPHYLCIYLCELATAFHAFYEACPVLKTGVPEEVRASRLALCALTAEALQLGLGLLGIGTLEEM